MHFAILDRSNRVNCGRCRARRALVEGYDTRARPFTRSKKRLRATGQKTTVGARARSGFEPWVGSRVSQPRMTKCMNLWANSIDFERRLLGIFNLYPLVIGSEEESSKKVDVQCRSKSIEFARGFMHFVI